VEVSEVLARLVWAEKKKMYVIKQKLMVCSVLEQDKFNTFIESLGLGYFILVACTKECSFTRPEKNTKQPRKVE